MTALVPIGAGVRGWRCPSHDLASAQAGWKCPRCADVGVDCRPTTTVVRKRRAGQDAEDGMARQLVIAGYVDLPAADARTSNDLVFVRQFAWGLYLPEPRKYAADFGFPSRRVLVEVDGGAHYAGRARGAYDTERRGLAASIGWTICPVTPDQVRDGTGIELVKSALASRPPVEGGAL